MASKMPIMDWKHEPLVDSFKAFKARMELFLMDNEVTDKVKQSIKIKIALGDEGMRRILSSGLTEDEKKDPDAIWKLIENQVDVTVMISFRIHRLEYSEMRQHDGENITDFVSRLREKASKCEFTAPELNERLIEMNIRSTPHSDHLKELLGHPMGHPISEVVKRGREYEAIAASQLSLNKMKLSGTASHTPAQASNVDAVTENVDCGNCGLHHAVRKCPAFHDECGACGSRGHWRKFCRKSGNVSQTTRGRGQNRGSRSSRYQSRSRGIQGRGQYRRQSNNRAQDEVNLQEVGESSGDGGEGFYAILISDVAMKPARNNEVFTHVHVSHKNPDTKGPLKLKVDTGSGGNTLPMRTYRQMFGETPTHSILTPEPTVKLHSYSGHTIPCKGSIILAIRKNRRSPCQRHKFYVVDVAGPAILGLRTSVDLHVVTLDTNTITELNRSNQNEVPSHDVSVSKAHSRSPPGGTRINSIDDLKWWFPDCFDRIGCLDGDAELYTKPGSNPHIDPPRRCPDALKPKVKEELDRMVSQNIIRKVTHHTDWCSSLTYVTKKDDSLRVCLDPKKLNKSLKRCPHQIPTVEEINPAFAKAKFFTKLDAKAGYWSVKLSQRSQEITTFRTPFGRYCFMRLPFGLCVSQDIFQQRMDTIMEQCEGCVGISDDIVITGDTEQQHDDRLIHFLKVAQQSGLTLNSSKCMVKCNRITFFGRVYTDHGVFSDPDKIEDVRNMTTPQDKPDLLRFLGLITYLSPHLPKLADRTAILRDLTKEDVPFEWSEDHEAAFNNLKTLVATNIGLSYYDQNSPVTLEVDASIKGLGAVLVQNDKPIAFASKTLTTTQSNYSNIERECLAVVFGIQRFHHYLYGRPFTVKSDHKPLEMIVLKPLHIAPPRLQRMLTQIQGYDFKLVYKPGVMIDSIEMDLLHFAPVKQHQLREETTRDTALRALGQVIYTGWPDKLQDLPGEIRDYWSYRDELAMENGVIFKGRQVLVPPVLQGDILAQLHSGHQGIEKTRRLARESVFWPRINKDIENLCKNCEPCQELQPQQPRQPMIMHEKPLSPWTKVGTDLFEIGGRNYIIISDYFSRYPIIKLLSTTTSHSVVSATKETFSMLGVPREIISDNGPQYQREYNEFCESWGILHTTSSPRHPQSNGFIERQIRYIKPIIKKCLATGGDVDLALLNVRATPLDTTLPSPAELMFGRPISTTLPSRSEKTQTDKYHEHMRQTSDNQKRYADNHTKLLPPLVSGQHVRVLDNTRVWARGTVLEPSVNKDRSYLVQTDRGSQLVRNRVQIRDTPPPKPQVVVPHSTSNNPPTEATMPKPSDVPDGDPRQTGSDGRQTRSGRTINLPARYRDTD